MAPGFRPVPRERIADFFPFTGIITLTPAGSGTRYHAHILHGTAEDRDKDAAMGFEEGWGKAFEQRVEFMTSRGA